MNKDIDNELASYVKEMTNKNLSHDTATNYHGSILRFLCHTNKTSKELTKEDILNYVNFLKQKLCQASLKQELTRIRKYLELKEIKYVENGKEKSISHLIEIPTDTKSKIKEPYSEQDIDKFMKAIKEAIHDSFYQKRAEAMFAIMFYIPMRRKEITLLEKEGDEGFRIEDTSLFIHRIKRGEDWRYPLDQFVFEKIMNWLEHREQHRLEDVKKSKWLFVDKKENPIKRGRVSDDYFECAKIAGLSTGTHICRHTVLTHAAPLLKDSRHLKQLAGHKHPIGVDSYIRTYLRTLDVDKEIHDSYQIINKNKND
jgi:site-specific recombinase XerD